MDEASARFGELLRDHRHAAGLTQEELAERAGVSPRSISDLERGGAHVPRRDTVALLVRALGLVGPDREAFEAPVERRRRARPARRARGTATAPPAQPAVGRPRHNLPRSLTSFVGREPELVELGPLLAAAPLLTLVGAGGLGKSRLAQELVRQQVASYPDGVWLVDLAALTNPAPLAGAIAAAVGLSAPPARVTTDGLAEYLRPKRLLLVLDNCEHLIEACAEVVAHLLRMCPQLRVLATSREPLSIGGEVTWRVPPFELPDPRQRRTADQARPAAVRLFVERARAVNNAFVLTAQNAPAVARICVGVDGIPLALELAAARTRLMTVEQLADRLERDPGVLSSTDRVGLPRHRTMRATIDWSHDLLAEPEQLLFRRLSVFSGGWTLETAEEVCSGDGVERSAVLDLLAQLVDKSMVVTEARHQVARYRLLEPFRQYAAERLEGAGEETAYRARHAAALLALAQLSAADETGPDEIASLDRLEAEHDNLRVALRWALTQSDGDAALRSTAALHRLWERRGHFQEGSAWLEGALAMPGASEVDGEHRGWALNALAGLYWRGGDVERARPIAELALAVNREAGHVYGVAWALGNLGAIAYVRGEPELAVAWLEESVAVARQIGDQPFLSLSLTYLGRALLRVNGPWDPGASEALDEAVGRAEAAQSLYATGHALATQGDLVWKQGRLEPATVLWRQALTVRSRLADRRGIAGCLERLAVALAAGEQLDSAAWLFGAAEAQHRALGIELRQDEEADHGRYVATTRQQLGDGFATAWSAGHAATVDEAVARALDATRSLPGAGLARSAERWIAPGHPA